MLHKQKKVVLLICTVAGTVKIEIKLAWIKLTLDMDNL